ncbi:hypothetical protein [Marinisporobacter balticus]|nr:hypothetical protein [Marinisporobacter balticus]
MKILNKQILCKAGTKINEDVANMNEYGAWVLDGATGLNGENIVDGESDAKWFVTWWDTYLSNNIYKDENLQKIIEKGIKLIKEEFFNRAKDQNLSKIDFPSSSIVVIKWEKSCLEYFSLGDVLLMLQNEDKIQMIIDHNITKLDHKVFKAMEHLMEKEKKNMIEAKEDVMDLIVSNRLLKNTENGYWILGFNETAAKNGLYGTIKLGNNTKVFIASDGFTALADKYNYLNISEFIPEIEKTGVDKLYHILRDIEEKDSEGQLFPRFKKTMMPQPFISHLKITVSEREVEIFV